MKGRAELVLISLSVLPSFCGDIWWDMGGEEGVNKADNLARDHGVSWHSHHTWGGGPWVWPGMRVG